MSYNDEHSKTQNPFTSVNNSQNRKKYINVHELQKKELLDQTENRGFVQETSLSTIGRVSIDYSGVEGEKKEKRQVRAYDAPEKQLKAVAGIVDRKVYLDTDFKDTSSDLSNGLLRFPLLQLNQNYPIQNVIEMQIGSFFIPEIATGASFPTYFFFQRVHILIEEMQAQSIFGPESQRFHFEMDLAPSGIANELTPASNEGKFIFSKPFRDVNQLTFRFTSPRKNVVFPQDVFTYTSVAGTSPARITTSVAHGLTVASSVSIFSRDFASNVGNVDALINSVDGHLVTVIDATTLEFPAVGTVGFDFTGIGAVTGELTVGFRRIAFVMRFRSIVDAETNGIVPT